MNNHMIVDLGSGYVKYGTPWMDVPHIKPSCYPAQGGEQVDPKLLSLDPGRENWVFPLECGILPNTELLFPLLRRILQSYASSDRELKKLDMTLLLFPNVDLGRASLLCSELQRALGCKSVTSSIQQVFSLAYAGLRSGIVVDVGYSVSFVVPLYQGFLLHEHVAHLATGSLFVSAQIRRLLIKAANQAPPSLARVYSKLAEEAEAINYIKRHLLQVASNPADASTLPGRRVYRRGGLEAELGHLVWQAPEVLFQPALIGMGDVGLTEAVINVLQEVDPEVRAELASKILLVGGGSTLPGLRERMVRELKAQLPHLSIKVFVPKGALFSAWLGAASLARKGARLPWRRSRASRM